MTQFTHVNFSGDDTHLGGVIIYPPGDALLALCNAVVAEDALCRFDAAPINQIVAQAEPPVLQPQWLFLMSDEQQAITGWKVGRESVSALLEKNRREITFPGNAKPRDSPRILICGERF